MATNLDIKKWNEIQETIWRCELCGENKRVACNIRQQTESPMRPVKLMLLGVAPPHVAGVETKTIARSATNNPEDNLRAFMNSDVRDSWDDLLERGLFLVHGVKCAITPEDRHQNPPVHVIDDCAPPHFVQEILLIKPSAVVVFGKAPFRALLRVPGRPILNARRAWPLLLNGGSC